MGNRLCACFGAEGEGGRGPAADIVLDLEDEAQHTGCPSACPSHSACLHRHCAVLATDCGATSL